MVPSSLRALATSERSASYPMTMKKKVAVLLVAAVLVAVSLMLGHVTPQEQRITEENFRRIHAGMDRSEVVDILGEPGDYRSRPTNSVEFRPRPNSAERWDLWRGDALDVYVGSWAGSSEEGKVFFATNEPARLEDVGVVRLLLWRIKRMWDGWTTPTK
jgi:hypothetical protein